MHKGEPPPYSKAPKATRAKKPSAQKPLVHRLLARFGLYRGPPQTRPESHRDVLAPRISEAPAQRRTEATHTAPVEAELPKPKLEEISPESEPEPEDERALKQCRRCTRLFYHPISASDPYSLRMCGRRHPGQYRKLGDIINERGEGPMWAWEPHYSVSPMVWDCCLTESKAHNRSCSVEDRATWEDIDHGCVASALDHICRDEDVTLRSGRGTHADGMLWMDLKQHGDRNTRWGVW
ncbi:hypothetical protein QBC34DRAFT_169679 [Podospora aff. communis PSN243]|uniref:Uncharacterized protein n=1 Tax=Podospora aff. communis PSN243 TaxID=3040156 RepID=A0AAV9GCK2_9PEZI|nr:hypothetical protein QBC34DRAFT_169679 [Podospora aff. communis PSN243]